MANYTYKLNKVNGTKKTKYMRDELESLTTLQLREICYVEKIAVGMGYRLNRDFMIETILKYRGYENHSFINTYEKEKYDKFKNTIMDKLSIIENDRSISIPTKISVYKDSHITEDDDIQIVNNTGNYESNGLVIDNENNVRGIINVKELNGKYYLTYNNKLTDNDLQEGLYKNFSICIFTEKSSRFAYEEYHNLKTDRPSKFNVIKVKITELFIRQIHYTENVLVIDFGTSNTSAGAYERGTIKEVKFSKRDKDNVKLTEILPTVIGVTDCRNEIEYEFGYDALKGASRNSYNTSHSVFYGIKKWVNNYSKFEEITDKEGNHSVISRKEILKAYLLYIIEKAEIQHKCKYKKIHITSPIKQKEQFLQMYKEVLTGYEVEIDNSLDEGIAVLYNSMSNQIEKQNFINNEVYKALVIDCGGGTTDLTSCKYVIEDERITYKLDITTTYANGETNFGGNSLTFRIFQYLKVLFANYYIENSYINAESLFDTDTQGIYRFTDELGVKKIYEKLNFEYEKAEEYIPTKFKLYKYLDPNEFMKIRSNFYFLWNLAERIKLQFYQSLGRSITDFHEKGLKVDAMEKKILSEESFRINVLDNGVFKLKTKLPQLVISKEEVDLLIKGDIYYIIKKFIEPLYESGDLENFDLIKLTGQTCKIDIFRDALKEFIAGRFIQSTSSTDKQLRNFKLGCLEGAIKYENAHKIGKITPTIKNESPITPYQLIGYAHNGQEVELMSNLSSLVRTYGFISKSIETRLIELILKNGEGNVVHNYDFTTDFLEYVETDYEEVLREFEGKILQVDVDQILDNEIKLFTFSYGDKWGFTAVPIARKHGLLYKGGKVYYPFENDEWEVNYFDGEK